MPKRIHRSLSLPAVQGARHSEFAKAIDVPPARRHASPCPSRGNQIAIPIDPSSPAMNLATPSRRPTFEGPSSLTTGCSPGFETPSMSPFANSDARHPSAPTPDCPATEWPSSGPDGFPMSPVPAGGQGPSKTMEEQAIQIS